LCGCRDGVLSREPEGAGRDGPRGSEAEGWWTGVPSGEEVLADDEVIGWAKNGRRKEEV